MPIFSKANVGGACLAVETAEGGGACVTALQFAAGSAPDRLRGFNRFGATQEAVREENGRVTAGAYVSFMTASNEKGLAEARQAFAETTHAQTFSIARGVSNRSGCAFELIHRAFQTNYTWRDCFRLLRALGPQTALPASKPPAGFGGAALPTFLFAVHRALISGAGRSQTYAHNGQVYQLQTEPKLDTHTRQLVIHGRTCRISEKNEADFKLWMDPADRTALPSRVEFRSRSFLKLTLERAGDVETGDTVLKPLLRS